MLTLEISKFSDAKQWLKLKSKGPSRKGPFLSNLLTSEAKSFHTDYRPSLTAQA